MLLSVFVLSLDKHILDPSLFWTHKDEKNIDFLSLEKTENKRPF